MEIPVFSKRKGKNHLSLSTKQSTEMLLELVLTLQMAIHTASSSQRVYGLMRSRLGYSSP